MTREQELFSECKAIADKVMFNGGMYVVCRNAAIFALGMGLGFAIEKHLAYAPALVFLCLSAVATAFMVHFDTRQKLHDARLKLKQSELKTEQSKPTTPRT